MNQLKRVLSILLIALMIVPLISSVSFATPQSDLDAGYVQMTTNGSVLLRSGKTYFIAITGGRGGTGGRAYSYKDQRYYYEGRAGSYGTPEYYKVEVTGVNNIDIDLYIGNQGGAASYSTAGSGVGNPSSLGAAGSAGAAGVKSERFRWDGEYNYAYGGGGGGGGGATMIRFSNNNNYRITGTGGKGATGRNATKGDSQDILIHGSPGGAGGSIPNSFASIPGVKVEKLTTSGKVSAPSVAGASIKEQVIVGQEGIAVTDIKVNGHIILTNSVTNEVTIYKKDTLTGLTFTRVTGETGMWNQYGKYVVSGDSYNIIVKSDLRFVGGEGTVDSPYYPEPAGSGGGSSGGITAEQSFQNTELLTDTILTVTNSIENMIQKQEEIGQAEQAAIKSQPQPFIPFSLNIKSLTNATATKATSMDVMLKIEGRPTAEIEYKIERNGSVIRNWTISPETGKVNIPLTTGYNSIIITIRDSQLNTTSDVINVWKL